MVRSGGFLHVVPIGGAVGALWVASTPMTVWGIVIAGICVVIGVAVAVFTKRMQPGLAFIGCAALGPIGLAVVLARCLPWKVSVPIITGVVLVGGAAVAALYLTNSEAVYEADLPRIERQIAFDLQQGYQVESPDVRCPSAVDWTAGTTFDCDVSSPAGTGTATLTVMMQEDFAYEWALD